MNIRIPYEVLGNVDSYQFVSLILDKNRQSVYRQDFVRGENFDVFLDKKEFISVPDEYYNECDSVIFFPFSRKTNNWTSKILMWKNEDFIRMNGGFELVRNAETPPDMDKINLWLERGRRYDIGSPVVGKGNLIYFTLFGNNDYVKLLSLLLASLKKQPYREFDLLFITNKETRKLIKKIPEVKEFSVDFHIVNDVSDAVTSSMQKLKVYEYKKVSEYTNILFLDVDILVVGDVKRMFTRPIKPNVLYSATHNYDPSLHKTVYHSLADYTKQEYEFLVKRGISSFNAGQFLFKNTDTMRNHFTNINEFISTWEGRYFFEQSFINYYFNLLGISDTREFKDQFQFVSINENQTSAEFIPESVFVHFMGNAGNGQGKLQFINKHYSKFL